MTEKEIKPNWERLGGCKRMPVKYSNRTIPRSCKGTGGYWYRAEVQDLKAPHSVCVCRLEDIETVKE